MSFPKYLLALLSLTTLCGGIGHEAGHFPCNLSRETRITNPTANAWRRTPDHTEHWTQKPGPSADSITEVTSTASGAGTLFQMRTL